MPSPTFSRLVSLVGVSLFCATIFAGCASNEPELVKPRPTQSETATPAPAATATPTPTPATMIPPSCNELLPPEMVHGYSPGLSLFAEAAEAESGLAEMLGPVTMGTLRGGTQQAYCAWGIQQSGAISYLGVAVIEDEAKADLLAALRDSVYDEVEPGNAEASFVQGRSQAHHYNDEIIVGRDFVVAVTRAVAGDFARDVFDQIQERR